MNDSAHPKPSDAAAATGTLRGAFKRVRLDGEPSAPRRPRRPTMTDVAMEAGVSQTTVSLVLNDAHGARLSDVTRRRVLDAAARLGYRMVKRGAPAVAGATAIGFVVNEIS